MKIENIKPIPRNIAKRIRKRDENSNCFNMRFYAYLTKIQGELVKITVACKNYHQQWFCKQVAVHGVHSDTCFVRDMEYTTMGYAVGWYDKGLTDYKKPYEDGKWYSAKDKYYDPSFAGVINPKYALKFEEYKYSAVDKYKHTDILKYLRIYEKYPQAEYFVKLGLQHLATNKTLLSKAGKDKNFRKWLIRNVKQLRNEYGEYPYYSGKVILAAYKENVSLLTELTLERERKQLLREYVYTNSVSKIISNKEIPKFLEYVHKQGTNIHSYADYLNACNYLGLDMSLPKNKYPHDFKRWHDIRIDEYHTAKALKDEQERKELCAKFATVAEKYLGLQRSKEAFIVVIARSPQDLIREGDILHHCVGQMNYDQRFIREESLIFFVRNASDPDTPFVTVEYSLSKHKVLQCYGEHDHKPNDNVLEFVNKKWLPFANRQLKKIQAAA